MKNSNLLILSILLVIVGINTANCQTDNRQDDKMLWWNNAKFGMFIHWGLYSKAEGYWKGKKVKSGGHFMIHEKISLKEYATLANDFNPNKFNADEWVLLAKKAGMKYMVITAKHHEGLAMYNSPSNDYNIVARTPYKKDPMAHLAKACQKHGVKLCFYYSLGRDGEGIYGTEPWKIACETLEFTPNKKQQEGESDNVVNKNMIDVVNDATSKKIVPEIRFTTKGDYLYAFVCSSPEKEVVIESLALGENQTIKEVFSLGDKSEIQ